LYLDTTYSVLWEVDVSVASDDLTKPEHYAGRIRWRRCICL